MALQSSGAISLNDIQTEFGGSNPIGINEYYGSGGAPASGTISIGDFYGRGASGSPLDVTILLMAGGGSAESDQEDPRPPGGGGGGGLLTQELSNVTGSNSVTVGASDGNSSFPSATTAIAGGYTFSGGESTGQSGNGGSGGGASDGGRGNSFGGTGTPGQGNPGTYYNAANSGGGGGKGSAGSGYAGGSGYNIADFRGGPTLDVAYGAYAYVTTTPAANTGGGAGDATEGGVTPGGSGIVIIRYPGSTARATGGNSTYARTVGGVAYYFHEFTSSGTFTKS